MDLDQKRLLASKLALQAKNNALKLEGLMQQYTSEIHELISAESTALDHYNTIIQSRTAFLDELVINQTVAVQSYRIHEHRQHIDNHIESMNIISPELSHIHAITQHILPHLQTLHDNIRTISPQATHIRDMIIHIQEIDKLYPDKQIRTLSSLYTKIKSIVYNIQTTNRNLETLLQTIDHPDISWFDLGDAVRALALTWQHIEILHDPIYNQKMTILATLITRRKLLRALRLAIS